MNRTTSLGWVGAALVTFAAGCADFDVAAPGGDELTGAEKDIRLPICDDENSPLVCGWENGAPDWFNLFQKEPTNSWLHLPSYPGVPALPAMNKPWQNDWEEQGTNSYALGWSQVWSTAWASWDFSGPRFAWALHPLRTLSHCDHPTSEIGDALPSGCSPIATAVCAQLPSCCGILPETLPGDQLPMGFARSSIIIPRFGTWGSACVTKAVELAEAPFPGHPPTETGAPLPKVGHWTDLVLEARASRVDSIGGIHRRQWVPANPCATRVCRATSLDYCCTSQWDESCVTAALDQCSARYTANTRVESENAPPVPPPGQPDAGPPSGALPPPAGPEVRRVFTDVCYEATVPGFTACPVQRSNVNGNQECCRRALVLRGVYTGIDSSDPHVFQTTDTAHFGRGRLIDWVDSKAMWVAHTAWAYELTDTLALDNCYVDKDGVRTCEQRKHKLWQTAGPGGPLYPDYPEIKPTNYPSGCPATVQGLVAKPVFTTKFERCTDWTHAYLGYRRLLMATLSALITTDSAHAIDFQWAPDKYYDDNGVPIGVSEHSIEPFVDAHPVSISYIDINTWEGNWGTDSIGSDGHLQTSASCYGPMSPQRASGDLVRNVPDCDPWHPGGHIQTFFNVPLVLEQ